MKDIVFTKYEIIHDSEFEMLLVGKNQQGEYLLASFIEEDYEARRLYYLHLFVNESIILDFILGKISYLTVIQKANQIYKVKKKYNYDIIDAKIIIFDELLEDERPLKNSFFPRQDLTKLIKDLSERSYRSINMANLLPYSETVGQKNYVDELLAQKNSSNTKNNTNSEENFGENSYAMAA
jgi:hypothetical protein